MEVDFIYRYHGLLYAIEVKSGRRKSPKGLDAFMKQFPGSHPVILTPENFQIFSIDPLKFLSML